MPIFMDRHDVSETVTAEMVARLHQEDLKIQNQFSCRGLTYWFDDKRKTAFCLVEAPNRNAIIRMHEQAHGEVPHQIIEVDATIVESFLGRIEDPERAQNTQLNIINDPAFRTIMVLTMEHHFFRGVDPILSISMMKLFFKEISAALTSFEGRVVQLNEDALLLSFLTVTNAVSCALKIRTLFREFRAKYQNSFTDLSMGLHAGIPVKDKERIFEDTVNLAKRMGFIVKNEIVVSTEVSYLFESENLGEDLSRNQIFVLTPEEAHS